jgi:hypothetical protein
MGTSLTGKNISASYLGLLKTTDNAIIGSTAKRLTDGGGTDSPLYLSTTQLGIGVSPMTKLHVQGTDVTSSPSAEQLIVAENNGNTAIGIFSSLTGQGSIDFGDSADNNAGRILYEHNDNNLSFSTNGSRKMSILSDGKIGIGTSTVSSSAFMEIKGVGSLSTAIVKLMPSDASSTTALYNTFDGADNQMSQYGTVSGDTILQHIASSGELKLRVNGTTGLTMNQSQNIKLDAYGSGSITGTATQRLGVDSSGNVIEIPIGAGALDGSGTAGRVAKFTDSDTLGNSGISDSSNALAITINGNEEVGIGTTPLKKLHISTSDDVITLFQSTDSISRIEFADNNTTGSTRPSIGASGNNTIFTQGSTERMRLDSSGRLGLGTTSPSTKLHIEGASVGYLQTIKNTTAGGDYLQMLAETGDPVFEFQSGGTGGEAILNMYRDGTQYVLISADAGVDNYFNNGSNLGIGNSSPDSKLDVSGDITIQQGSDIRWKNTARDTTYGVIEGLASATVFKFDTSEKMRLDSSGDLTMKGGRIIVRESDDGNDAVRISRDADEGYVQLFSSGSQTVELRGNGASYFNGGNVGIGTTSPSKLLTLNQASGEVGILLEGNGTDVGMLKIPSAGVNHALQFGTISNNEVSFYTNNSEKMRIHQDGNVGIGNSSPVTTLTLGTGTTGMSFISSDTSFNSGKIAVIKQSEVGSGNGHLLFETYEGGSGGGERMRIASDGVVSVNGAVSGYGQFNVSGTDANPIIVLRSTSGRARLGYFESGSGRFYIESLNGSNGLKFIDGDGSSERMRIDSSGTVSVATGSLRLDGTAKLFTNNDDLTISSDDNGNGSDGRIMFRTVNAERMRIHSTGRVSIGSTTASANTLTLSGTGTELDMTNTSTNGRSYRIESDSAGLFVIKDRDANADRIILNSSGNVGIGTTSPATKLDVNSGISSSSASVISISQNTTGAIKQAAAFGVAIQNGGESTNASDLFISTASGGSLSERMRITSGGQIGVGVTSPSNKVHIYDATSDSPLRIESGDGYVGIKFKDPDNDDNLFYRGDIQAFYFTGDRLGVNTASPATEFHVKASSGFAEARLSGASGSGSSLEFYEDTTALADIYANTSKDLIFRTNGTTERARITSGGDIALQPSTNIYTLRSDSVSVPASTSTTVLDFTGATAGVYMVTVCRSGVSTAENATYIISFNGTTGVIEATLHSQGWTSPTFSGANFQVSNANARTCHATAQPLSVN